MIKPVIAFLPVVATVVAGWATAGLADDDHDRAMRLRESGDILPLAQIVREAGEVYAGRILEVELKREHGRYVYEIEMLAGNGQVLEMQFDARTAELLRIDQEH